MGIGTTCEIALLCIDTIYRSSNDEAIISAYRKYRELMGLPRYAEWNYYKDAKGNVFKYPGRVAFANAKFTYYLMKREEEVYSLIGKTLSYKIEIMVRIHLYFLFSQ